MASSALRDKLAAFQPFVSEQNGAEIALWYGSAPDAVESEYWTLRREAGLIDLSHRGRILVHGVDAARFLHGMVTNDVQGLRPGGGQYAFLLNVHGHILSDTHIFRLDENSFLLDCQAQSNEVIWQALEHHIIMDDVTLDDLRNQLCLFAIEGPMARRALENSLSESQAAIAGLTTRLDHVHVAAIDARIIRGSLSGDDGYWILASEQRASEWLDSLLAPGVSSQDDWTVRPAGSAAVDVRRIEAGIPRYGIDITEKNLPQETGQLQALSFDKGCYIGQEVVERIRSRGHVNRTLMRVLIDGRREIAPSTEILFGREVIGATASSAYCFGMDKTVAFCYLRREFAEAGRIATVAGFSAVTEELPPASSSGLQSTRKNPKQ